MGSPPHTHPATPVEPDRLNGWKEIASCVGRGVRTVQRWEHTLGLPVRRLRHERGEVVFASRSEIEAWLRQAAVRRAMSEPIDPASSEVIGSESARDGARADARGGGDAARRRLERRRLALTALGVALGVAAAAVLIGMGWRGTRTPPPPEWPVGIPRQLTSSSGWEAEPAISPDGRYVAYVSNASNSEELWVVDARGGEPQRLTAGSTGCSHPTWFPDGNALAFVSSAGGRRAVWKLPRTGGTPVLLLADAAAPAISPDGTRLAFVRPGALGYGRIFVGSLSDLGNARAISTDRDGLWHHEQPAWSPDGTWISYAAGRDLWVVPAAGGAARRLTSDGQYDREPTWSSDGRSVYFSSFREGNQSLWRAAASGGRPGRLTTGNTSERDPNVSRDGARLAYSTYDENPDLVLRDLRSGTEHHVGGVRWESEPTLSPDGRAIVYSSDWIVGRIDLWYQALSESGEPDGAPRRLTETSGSVAQPRFSRDGRWIAYHQVIDGQRDVWVVPVSGGPPIRVTDDPAPDTNPEWSPDGRAIVFVSARSGTDGLWVMPVAEGRPAGPARPLTGTGRSEDAPAWSPDGSTIAFIVWNDRGGSEVWTVSPRGGEARPLTTGAGAQRVAWEPSSRSLLVSGFWNTPQITIRRIDASVPGAQASEPLAWLGSHRDFIDLSLSGDGRLLAFARPNPRGDIWVVDAKPGTF